MFVIRLFDNFVTARMDTNYCAVSHSVYDWVIVKTKKSAKRANIYLKYFPHYVSPLISVISSKLWQVRVTEQTQSMTVPVGAFLG